MMDGALLALLAETLGVFEEESWTSLTFAGVLTVRDLDNVAGKLLQQWESRRKCARPSLPTNKQSNGHERTSDEVPTPFHATKWLRARFRS